MSLANARKLGPQSRPGRQERLKDPMDDPKETLTHFWARSLWTLIH